MRILYIGGNHPRHLYYIHRLAMTNNLVGAIIERRENILPTPPPGLCDMDKDNFIRHFKERDQAEKKYFGNRTEPACETLNVNAETLNTGKSVEFAQACNAQVALVFGTHLIGEPLLSSLPLHTVNLHLGLSPRYRGAATLFWPFYFMEPNYAGSTFHFLIPEADAGDVIHQVVPYLSADDGIHDVACKTVVASTDAMGRLLEMLDRGTEWETRRQKATGKNFLGSDFLPEHLRVIYNVFDNDIVKCFLEKKISGRVPELFVQPGIQ